MTKEILTLWRIGAAVVMMFVLVAIAAKTVANRFDGQVAEVDSSATKEMQKRTKQ